MNAPEESTPDHPQTTNQPLPSYADSAATPHLPPPSTYTLFPQEIFIYRTEYISLILGPPYTSPSAPPPPPLFQASIHMDPSSRTVVPNIRLHFGPDDTYPVVATSWFRKLSADLVAEGVECKLQRKSVGLADVYYVDFGLEGAEVERFEWRHSHNEEVRAFARENVGGEDVCQGDRGLKLVRASTGQMLAIYCGGKHSRLLNPKRVAGKLRFVGESVLPPLVVVMSILTIIERSRRTATAYANADCVVS